MSYLMAVLIWVSGCFSGEDNVAIDYSRTVSEPTSEQSAERSSLSTKLAKFADRIVVDPPESQKAQIKELQALIEDWDEATIAQIIGLDAMRLRGDRITMRLEPALPRDESFGKRVMIIDYGEGWVAQWARYRNKILAVLTKGKNSSLMPFDFEVTYQKSYFLLASLLDSRFPRLQSQYVAKALATANRSDLEFDGYDYDSTAEDKSDLHGYPVLSALAEYSPESQFVLVEQRRSQYVEMGLCQITTALGEREFRTNLKAHAESLVEVIERFKIDFVNMSWGIDPSSTPQQLGKCPNISESEYERAGHLFQGIWVEEFLNVLASAPDVIIVQATPGSRSDSTHIADSHIADCATVPNRIRVGAMKTYQEIYERGSEKSVVDNTKKVIGPWHCTDLYLNSHDSNPPITSLYSLGKYAFDIPGKEGLGTWGHDISSSFFAPMALAHLIWIKEAFGISNREELLSKVKDLYGERKAIDPHRYHQFENYRLGLRKQGLFENVDYSNL